MKTASLSFFLLLVYTHAVGDTDRLLRQPLSQFRDGEQWWLGYALFLCLMVTGLSYFRALRSCGREVEAGVSWISLVLLLAVALTPSLWISHHLLAFALLLLLFGYYAVLLARASRLLLLPHLLMPLLLASLTQFHSYGAWQKGLVSYFVLAAAVHHALLRPGMAVGDPDSVDLRGQAGIPSRRRKVYRVDPGPAWARRRPASTPL